MLLNLIQVELYLSDLICNQFLKIALFQTFEKNKNNSKNVHFCKK